METSKRRIRDNFRKNLETQLNCTIGLIKVITNNLSYEEFMNTITEQLDLSSFNLTNEEIKEILFDLTSKYFTQEELLLAKKKMILNQNNSYILETQIIKYLSPEEITEETLSSMTNKKISTQLCNTIKKLLTENPDSLDCLLPEMLDEEIVSLLGQNFERIILYEETQRKFLTIFSNKEEKMLLSNLLKKLQFTSAEIEILCDQIIFLKKENPEFLSLLCNAKVDTNTILFFLKNQKKASQIKTIEEIEQYETLENKRCLKELQNAPFENIKEWIFQILYHKNLQEIEELLRKFGTDIEELEKANTNVEFKKYITQMVQIKKIYNTNDPQMLKYYLEYNKNLPNSSIELNVNLEKKLKEAYNINITKTLSQTTPEKQVIEENKEQGYRIVKTTGEFQKMVSVIDAFGEENNIPLYEKLHGPGSKVNHARCYSLCSDKNLGIYHAAYNPNAVIIQIEGFDPNALIAASNEDIGSNSANNISDYYEEKTFYTVGPKYEEKIRSGYSEFVIENERNGKITQVSSLICLDKVNEETKKAATELAQKYGHPIDIEVIDTLELIKNHYHYMTSEYQKFLETKDPTHLIHYIRQYLNDYSAFSRVEKYWNLFNENGILDPQNIYNSIQEAVSLIAENKESMNILETYIKEEQKLNAVINTIYDMNDKEITLK